MAEASSLDEANSFPEGEDKSEQLQLPQTAFSATVGCQVVGVLLEGIAAPGQKDNAVKEIAAQKYQDLGLGRGIDATRTKPWLNRTSFQVRPVHFDDLIGTDEGSSLETYESTVLSSQSLHMKMQGQLAVPVTNGPPPVSPKVEIGVDCEAERTISTERRVIGRRVINRTISFKEELHDLPFLYPFASPVQSEEVSKLLTFEDTLSRWILERLDHCHKHGGCKHPCPSDEKNGVRGLNSAVTKADPPSRLLRAWLAAMDHLSCMSLEMCIKGLCLQFVKFLHATHYVSAIKLGALEYGVMTESVYLQKIKSSGTIGLEKLVNTSATGSKSSFTSSKINKSRKIGIIGTIGCGSRDAAYVQRNSQQEAVIHVEIKPIYQLVRHPFLGSLLQTAVKQYMEDQKDPRMRPFYIASYGKENEIVYLAVDKPRKDQTSLLLCATTVKAEAVPLRIIQSDEGDGINEFNIVYELKDVYKDHNSPRQVHSADSLSSYRTSNKLKSSAWYYLCTPLTVRGTSSSPPCFKLRSNEKNCLFVLRSPLKSNGAPPEDLDPWLSGQEEYFINCRGGHRLRRNGYLGIRPEYKNADDTGVGKQATTTDDVKAPSSKQNSLRKDNRKWRSEESILEARDPPPRQYVPTCCSSRGTGEHHFMIFKLLPVTK